MNTCGPCGKITAIFCFIMISPGQGFLSGHFIYKPHEPRVTDALPKKRSDRDGQRGLVCHSIAKDLCRGKNSRGELGHRTAGQKSNCTFLVHAYTRSSDTSPETSTGHSSDPQTRPNLSDN